MRALLLALFWMHPVLAGNEPTLNPLCLRYREVKGVRHQIEASAFQVDKGLHDYTTDFSGTAFTRLVSQVTQARGAKREGPLVWLNLGAGDAVAERELLREAPAQAGLQVVSVGYEGPSSQASKRGAWEKDLGEISRTHGPGAIQYLETKSYRHTPEGQTPLAGEEGFFYNVPDTLLPMADLVTDQRGVNNFTRHFSENFAKTLGRVKTGGYFVGTLPADPGYFEILGRDGKALDPAQWFRTIQGVEVVQFRKERREENGEVFHIWIVELRRNGEPLKVPSLKLVHLDDSVPPPPKRTFQAN